MGDPVSFSEEQRDFAASVRGYLSQCPTPERFSRELWTGLAGLGAWSTAAADEYGAAGAVAAVSVELGRARVAGPVAGTFFAIKAADHELAEAVAAGSAVATLCVGPYVPWADEADVVIEREGDEAWLVERVGVWTPRPTLGGEAWSTGERRRAGKLGNVQEAMRLVEVCLAGRLVGLALTALETSIEYARSRVQFGVTIGSHEAVAHPLVNARLGLRAAETLVAVAANAVDARIEEMSELSACAVLSAARAACDASLVAHQAMGAIGYTLEGPLVEASRQIRQLATVAQSESTLARRALSSYHLSQIG